MYYYTITFKNRQTRAYRLMMLAVLVFVLLVLGTGTAMLFRYGYAQFVFRSAGTGATPN